ncbi:MAG: YceI family protein [Rhodothermales bacterium]|nr:YceI family protein [Rhodothermales bacterium]MBO6778723.1 YceI family protein [Rhodothermales bacterium]
MRLITLLAALVLVAPVAAQSFLTETGHAEFESSVPLHSFVGESDALVGRISLPDSTVDFYLDLETLDTGIRKRDKDMRKTLKTDEFPFAEFFGKLTSDFDPAGGVQDVSVEGTFTIHGVSRPLTVEGTLEPTADGMVLNAAWVLNLDDYDIKPPSLLIVKVDPQQKIQISALLPPEPGT